MLYIVISAGTSVISSTLHLLIHGNPRAMTEGSTECVDLPAFSKSPKQLAANNWLPSERRKTRIITGHILVIL